MLADANLDAQQFAQPGNFDIERPNNATALSFGYGMHACLASAFCINLATKVLHHLAINYPNTQLEVRDLQYEPLPNVKLIKQLPISLS
jgi:cytochrome P450